MIKVNQYFLAGVLALASCNLTAVESYEVIDLGNLDERSIYAFDVNNANISVGYSYASQSLGGAIIEVPYHGTAVNSGVVSDLGAIVNSLTNPLTQIMTSQSFIFGINNVGMAVGHSLETVTKVVAGNDITSDFERAIYTDAVTPAINVIPPLVDGDVQHMRAVSVNDGGVIVGHSKFNAPDDQDPAGNSTELLADRGFIFDTNNQALTRVDPLNYNGEYLNVTVRDINQSGRVVGWSQQLVDNVTLIKSFYLDVTNPTALVEVPTSETNRSSFLFSINDSGKITGKRNIGDSRFFTSFIYDTNTQTLTDLTDLQPGYIPLGTADITIGYDINNQDQVVGSSLVELVPNTYHAFINEAGETKDLNQLIDCKVDATAEATGVPDWLLYEARAINDNGVIVGNGFLNNQKRAFMLIPRPSVEPKLCQPLTAEKSGSGSIPFAGIILLALAGLFSRQKRYR